MLFRLPGVGLVNTVVANTQCYKCNLQIRKPYIVFGFQRPLMYTLICIALWYIFIKQGLFRIAVNTKPKMIFIYYIPLFRLCNIFCIEWFLHPFAVTVAAGGFS
jgi:hypothetical protein